jgi:hypothetical protein
MRYGKDDGSRIWFSVDPYKHTVLSWKSESYVNTDADDGIDIAELKKVVTIRT